MASNRPISIEFVAEVADFLKGARGVEVSIEDVADALMAASNDAKDLERKMSKAMKDAEKDVESLERVIKDVPKATDKMADEAKKDFDRVADSASDAGREVGDEFRQNLGESVASGNLEDVISDTLGGIVSSFSGPLGIAAGVVAGAAALMFQHFKQQAEDMNVALGGMFDGMLSAMFETGREYQSLAERQKILTEAVKENPKEWKPVQEAAETLGLTIQDVGTAILDGGAETDALKQKLMDTVAEGTYLTAEGLKYKDGQAESVKAAQDLLHWINKGAGGLEETKDEWLVVQSASGISAANARAMSDALRNARDYAAGLGGRLPAVRPGQPNVAV